MEKIKRLIWLSEEEVTVETIAGNYEKRSFWKGRVSGLKAALRIINKELDGCAECKHNLGLSVDCGIPSLTPCPEENSKI